MANYAGFDTDVFPGLAQLAWLKAHTNLGWCGYYLAPAPSHQDTSWVGRRQALLAQGWGMAAIFVGQQTTGPGSHNAVGLQGSTDGALAAELARNEGFPAQSCIFLDWEDGSSPSPQAQAYISTWAHAVAETGYTPGIYCSHELAPSMAALIGPFNPASVSRIWAWKVTTVAAHPYDSSLQGFPAVDPVGCGYAPAVAWQCQQNCELSLPGAPLTSMQVDLSCACLADPSAPQ